MPSNITLELTSDNISLQYDNNKSEAQNLEPFQSEIKGKNRKSFDAS